MAAPTRDRVFRFAPSPNGELHLGHAYSAILNHDLARTAKGRFLLRMEDIDRARCTPAFESAIQADLAWLGLSWEGPVRRQSQHFDAYRDVLAALEAEGLVYPAFLSRGELRAHAAAFEEGKGRPWPRDPDGAILYPPFDRELAPAERRSRMAAGEPFAWRLNMERALERAGTPSFTEAGGDEGGVVEVASEPALWGDVVLARKSLPTSYHLSVVVDDALQGITDVVRGRDLLPSTSVHRVLQVLLGLPAPVYHHHTLILGGDGRKLSKSARDASLAGLRQAGMTARDVRRMVGL